MNEVANPQPFNQKKRLVVVQILAVFAILLILFSRPLLGTSSPWHEPIEFAGLALVLSCVFGRLWSILYVGDRKNNELVSSGPYSVTRNPLYFFSTLGATGIGLMFGSISLSIIFGITSYLVFAATAHKESQFLAGKFGRAYEDYARRTPSFFPNPGIYLDEVGVVFSPIALKKTFIDALYFLAIFPIIEFVEYLQSTSAIPTFLSII